MWFGAFSAIGANENLRGHEHSHIVSIVENTPEHHRYKQFSAQKIWTPFIQQLNTTRPLTWTAWSDTEQSPESLQVSLTKGGVRGMKEQEGGGKFFKGLNKIGSSPPSCEDKCYGCMPCKAIQVPTTISPIGVQYTNYEPEGWKCKCGPSFYTPWIDAVNSLCSRRSRTEQSLSHLSRNGRINPMYYTVAMSFYFLFIWTGICVAKENVIGMCFFFFDHFYWNVFGPHYFGFL